MNEDQWHKLVKAQQSPEWLAGWNAAKAEYVPVLMEHLRILADLRANVEALDVFVTTNNLLGTTRYVRLGDVLALLDGATDD